MLLNHVEIGCIYSLLCPVVDYVLRLSYNANIRIESEIFGIEAEMADFIYRQIEADLHLSVAFEIIDSALKWGKRGKFEDKIGVSRGYLAELMREMRPPSKELAERISQNLPLPLSQKQDVLDNFRLAIEKSDFMRQLPEERDWLEGDAIGELTRYHLLAAGSKSTQEASTYYRALNALGRVLVVAYRNTRGLKKQSLLVARAHTLLHDVLSVAGKPGSALFHARMARYWLQSVPEDNQTERLEVYIGEERKKAEVLSYDDLLINAIRSEAVSYNSLGLYAKANVLCDQALRNRAVQQDPAFWLTQVLRDKMNAISRLPRATVSDIEEIGLRARKICEENNDAIGLLLMHSSWARGYLIRRQYARAKDLLITELGRADRIPGVGQYPKARLLSHLATLSRKQEDKAGWEYYLQQATTIAFEAGLTGLSEELRQGHGDTAVYANIIDQLLSRRHTAQTDLRRPV